MNKLKPLVMEQQEQHKKITVADPNEFLMLLHRRASSNPLRKKMQLFIEAVNIMAGGDLHVADVRIANTLVPGHAKVAGRPEPVFGYLWEAVAFQPKTEEAPTTSVCFLSMNERSLFDRLYGNNPEADASLRFEDFEELNKEKA